jgi:hypothetical protein
MASLSGFAEGANGAAGFSRAGIRILPVAAVSVQGLTLAVRRVRSARRLTVAGFSQAGRRPQL